MCVKEMKTNNHTLKKRQKDLTTRSSTRLDPNHTDSDDSVAFISS